MAALSIRLLEMFVDVNTFSALPQVHRRLFWTTDVIMSGAVLGGGSDALHHLAMVFTGFFQRAKGRVEGAGPVRRVGVAERRQSVLQDNNTYAAIPAESLA